MRGRLALLLSLFLELLLLVHAQKRGVAKQQNTTQPDAGSSCLSRLNYDPAHFEPCKTQTCFLFLSQAPFIILDPTMRNESQQKLFPCKSPMKYFPKLDGVAFKIHQSLNLDDTLCVWAGPECTFDQMVKYVEQRAKDEKTKDYRFGITGLIAQLPERVSEYVIPTVQLFESEIVVLGPSNEFEGTVHAAFKQIFRAFESSTWVVLLVFIGLLVCLALVVSCVFTRPLSPFNVLMNLCGEHKFYFDVSDHLARDNDVRRSRALHRAAVICLGAGFSGFVVIVVLFYEISVVQSIVNQQSPKVGDLDALSNEALKQYSVLKNSSTERTLRRAADPTGTRFVHDSDLPWYRCWVDRECYDKVLDKNDKVKFMVALELEGRWNLQKRMACDSIVKYGTSNPLFIFSGSWYLGSSVNKSEYVRINQEIMRLKVSAKLRKIVETWSDLNDNELGQETPRVAPGVLAIPLIFIVGPCLLIVFLLIISGLCMRERVVVKDIASSQPDIWSNLGRSSPHGFEYET